MKVKVLRLPIDSEIEKTVEQEVDKLLRDDWATKDMYISISEKEVIIIIKCSRIHD